MSKLLNAHFHGCGGCRTAAAGPHEFQLHQRPIDVDDLAVATIALQVRPQLIQDLTAVARGNFFEVKMHSTWCQGCHDPCKNLELIYNLIFELKAPFLLNSLKFTYPQQGRVVNTQGPPGHCPRSRTALASPFCFQSLVLSSLPPLPLSFPGIPMHPAIYDIYAPQNASPLSLSVSLLLIAMKQSSQIQMCGCLRISNYGILNILESCWIIPAASPKGETTVERTAVIPLRRRGWHTPMASCRASCRSNPNLFYHVLPYHVGAHEPNRAKHAFFLGIL